MPVTRKRPQVNVATSTEPSDKALGSAGSRLCLPPPLSRSEMVLSRCKSESRHTCTCAVSCVSIFLAGQELGGSVAQSGQPIGVLVLTTRSACGRAAKLYGQIKSLSTVESIADPEPTTAPRSSNSTNPPPGA